MQKTVLQKKYETDTENSVDKVAVQCYKYVESDTDIIEVLKDFDNTDEANFYHSDKVTFDGTMHIKNSYDLEIKNNGNGTFITEEIDTSKFIDLYGIEVK